MSVSPFNRLKIRQRIVFSHAGKAELGLLAALALFVASVFYMIQAVVKSYRPPPVVAVDRPTKRENRAAVPADKTKSTAALRTVTIVADPKTIAAVDSLKGTIKDDGKPRAKKDDASTSPPQPAKTANYASELELDAQVLRPDSAQAEAAVAVLTKYWKTRTWQEKLPLVFQPDRVKPHMETFYGEKAARDPEFGSLVSASEIRVATRKVVSLCYRSTGRMSGVLHADFHRSPDGRLLLDWESLVGFSSRSMHDFRLTREEKETFFRVQAVRDDYYNFEFADEKKFVSFRLYTPDGDDYLHAYCERSSTVATKLLQVLGDSNMSLRGKVSSGGSGLDVRTFPITVALAFPLHAQSDRCVRLERFVSAWWLTPEREEPAADDVTPGAN